MKFVICALFAVAFVACVSADTSAADTVLRFDNDNIGVEGYNYGFETSGGISENEQGTLKNAGSENEAISVTGSFKYVGPDGVTYEVTYIADENGFQPQGVHIPK